MGKHAINFSFICGDVTLVEKSHLPYISFTHTLFTKIKNVYIIQRSLLSLETTEGIQYMVQEDYTKQSVRCGTGRITGF
jgi:hypothetical protein